MSEAGEVAAPVKVRPLIALWNERIERERVEAEAQSARLQRVRKHSSAPKPSLIPLRPSSTCPCRHPSPPPTALAPPLPQPPKPQVRFTFEGTGLLAAVEPGAAKKKLLEIAARPAPLGPADA